MQRGIDSVRVINNNYPFPEKASVRYFLSDHMTIVPLLFDRNIRPLTCKQPIARKKQPGHHVLPSIDKNFCVSSVETSIISVHAS